MRLPTLLLCLLALPAALRAVEPEIVELNFDRRFDHPATLFQQQQPGWLARVEQLGGNFSDEPPGWQVPTDAADGVGRLTISLDRRHVGVDLVAQILFDAAETTDLVVQLFDAQGRVVVVDLFGNLVDVGKDARTDTVVIPLRKYPTAERIVVRRIKGAVNVRGLVLYPVVTEGEVDNVEELEKLARVLGDPLSPENPLFKSLQNVAKKAKVTIDAAAVKKPGVQAINVPPAAERGVYPAAVAPTNPAKALPIDGLLAHWTFDAGNAADSGPAKLASRFRGQPEMMAGIRGQAVHLRRAHGQALTVLAAPTVQLGDALTFSAWVNYTSISPRWGSQIIWFGDDRLGRDPATFQLLTDGTLRFRSDRSVTGTPKFFVHNTEIQFSPTGGKTISQHVSVDSPKTLAPRQWYHVAATAQRTSPRETHFRLFVNGEQVNELKTPEAVNYPTDGMYLTLGGVDAGTWQNFDGAMDEVRVFSRPLAPAEIQALYRQPRQ